ncbi:MAG: phosphoribosyl-AMP cyclohydrolase, partial [Candidatus Hodgkinia cicadicola]
MCDTHDIKMLFIYILIITNMSNIDLTPVVVTDFYSGEVLMLAYIDSLCLNLSIRTGVAHYYSRRRKRIWVKGAHSGNLHMLMTAKLDCSATALCFGVIVLGDGLSCHSDRRSCFYRR